MAKSNPKISIVIPTYNRSHLLDRSVKGLLQQTYDNLELVYVNNGSTDDTAEVLKKYEGHPKIRVFNLKENCMCSGGMNYGFDKMTGEWFTSIGDDDQLVETALEEMIAVLDMDSAIDAITANAIDPLTDKFTGFGLEEDQYLPIETIVGRTSGEFFGITKSSLLGDKRLNAALEGDENTFWYKIDAIARRYYIHKGLKIWGTPDAGIQTESERFRTIDVKMRVGLYRELMKEEHYWEVLRNYNHNQYIARSLRGLFFMKVGGSPEEFKFYQKLLEGQPLKFKQQIIRTMVSGLKPGLLNGLYNWLSRSTFLEFLSKIFIRRYSKIHQG